MAEKARFFDSVAGDRPYNAADWAAVFATIVQGANGPVKGYAGELAVTSGGGRIVTLATGAAFISGHQYENTAALSFTLAANAAGSTRVDSVIIRLDLTNRTMVAAVLQGTPGAGAPGLTVTASVIEVRVANISVPSGATNADAPIDQRSFITIGGGLPVGAMVDWPVVGPPNGWLLCNGQAVSRTTYSALFAVIGTTFGAGDGSTTFLLPNTKGKFRVGYDPADAAYDTPGDTGGERTHSLTIAEMPAHTHAITLTTTISDVPVNVATEINLDKTLEFGSNTASTGGGTAHENRPPFIALPVIIKAV